jgi:predicted Holliday junction resolvase-like endonuclease
MIKMEFNLIVWIINALLMILVLVAGFMLSSLVKRVDENKKELDEDKKENENKFTTQVVCTERHLHLNEKLDTMDRKMDKNFIRLYDKIDVSNSIGDGLEKLSEAILTSINKE